MDVLTVAEGKKGAPGRATVVSDSRQFAGVWRLFGLSCWLISGGVLAATV